MNISKIQFLVNISKLSVILSKKAYVLDSKNIVIQKEFSLVMRKPAFLHKQKQKCRSAAQ